MTDNLLESSHPRLQSSVFYCQRLLPPVRKGDSRGSADRRAGTRGITATPEALCRITMDLEGRRVLEHVQAAMGAAQGHQVANGFLLIQAPF